MRKFLFILLLLFPVFMLTSCDDSGDDDDRDDMYEYVGTWYCTSPADYYHSTIVTVGTVLSIAPNGSMEWKLPNGDTYKASMILLRDDWVKVSYRGKEYTAEIDEDDGRLVININGNSSLTVKDFPFDGVYSRTK